VSYSAQGTRLNRRGLETRRRFLEVAVQRLAEGGPDAASANRIAHDAGFTWGTIQHQFGDADGVWAAVLEHVLNEFRPVFARTKREPPSLHRRSTLIVDALWRTHDSAPNRAVRNLQLALPHDREALARSFPATEAMLRQIDATWTASWEALFEDIDVAPTKLRRVRSLVPPAVRGLHDQAHVTTFTDVEDARQGLIDAITAYLE
jgi:AcrR family transcriptional regulator